jgi:multiple sugar transport system ATP-binding protein
VLYDQPVNLFVAGFIGSPPMNFLPAEVSGTTVSLPFVKVEVSPQVAERIANKGLLIAGLRPEHFEDAQLVDPAHHHKGTTFHASVDVIEWLGSEQYAYVPFDAPPEVTEKLKDLARELDSESMRTQLVVSLDAASRIKEGEPAELWVDPSRMHLFDPATGENLTRGVVGVEALA